jgi:hypothetical protein
MLPKRFGSVSSAWRSTRPASRAWRRRKQSRQLFVEALEARALMTLSGDMLFPADNPWNQKIVTAPVAANSSTLVASIGTSSRLHPDFGTVFEGANIGIPYNVVSGTQAPVHVVIDAYADESDLVDVPIPPGAVIEGDPLSGSQNDGDRHLMVYDKDNNIAYELFNVHRPSETSDGQWHADSEAVWDMSQNSFRSPGDTSADAAGLPILPGLVRVDEVLDQGLINHALRFTVPRSRNAYVFPASHQAGSNNTDYPRMGERFRLKQTFDISGFSPTNQVILKALKEYGMIVADNGSAWYLSGAPSSRWNDDDLHALGDILGSNFEALNLSPTVTSLDQSSGSTAGGTQVTIHGQGFSGAAGQLQVRFGTTLSSPPTILSDTVLVAIAPPHAAGTVHIAVQTPYGTSPATSADQFTFTAAATASVVGRRLFYNQSGTAGPTVRYDGNSSAINPADDAAIATDKTAYMPGSGPATFANISSYTKGINGIMIDIAGPHGTITASSFIFRVGNNNAPSSWTTAPPPASISVRAGAGLSGSDRVEIIWNNGDITKKWLQVVTKTSTGLPQLAGYATGYGDVFYFGNALANSGLGDTSTLSTVDVIDELEARNHPQARFQNVLITNIRDYNRDAIVDVTDALAARNNATSGVSGANPAVRYLNLSAGSPPNAPEGDGDGGGAVASASTASSGSSSQASGPSWLADSLAIASAISPGASATALLQLLGEDDSPSRRWHDGELVISAQPSVLFQFGARQRPGRFQGLLHRDVIRR